MSRKTVADIKEMKEKGQPIVMVTAYDYPLSRLAQEAGADILLVGDSLGNVVLGYESTTSVDMEDMVRACAAVARAPGEAHIVCDMPFLSFQISPEEALRNAGRLIREGGAQSVKMEGGRQVVPTVKKLVESGIPVMGHIGLTPQSVHQLGGYRVQGRSLEEARRLLEDALALEEAGVYSLVLEAVPWQLAQLITRRLRIPTIGIGAGLGCDGQVLVIHDLIGLSFGKPAKFVKRYAQVGEIIRQAVADFAADVREKRYPEPAHQYNLSPETWEALQKALESR
ncbi:MAG: 3-methyl-2-oxobutanoate hydroxymethyltransferase [Clostridiales bacterium]|nr:3-methyl-2-oxobutanoate hydroxymethyltransferase [Clostridiales bacterium]